MLCRRLKTNMTSKAPGSKWLHAEAALISFKSITIGRMLYGDIVKRRHSISDQPQSGVHYATHLYASAITAVGRDREIKNRRKKERKERERLKERKRKRETES